MSDPKIPVGALARWDGEKWEPVEIHSSTTLSVRKNWKKATVPFYYSTENPFKVK